MRVSAEGFLILNFVMNFTVLMLSSRGTWFLRIRRLLAASFFAAVYALLDAMKGLPLWSDAISLAGMLLIAFPKSDLRLFSKAAVLTMGIALSISGIIRALLVSGLGAFLSSAIGVMGGFMLAYVLGGGRLSGGHRLDVRVRARVFSRVQEFTALVDTGNLLTEPLSALPVLIADERALGKALFEIARQYEGVRQVDYASVGGNGKIACLKPDKIEVFDGRKWVRTPDMWLGFYPGRMNRGVHALAPGNVFYALSKR